MLLQVRQLAAIAAMLSCSALMAADIPENHSGFNAKTPSQTCLGCHSKSDVAKRTAQLNPNPHDSHRGFIDCMECHSFDKNKPSILLCNDCHAFDTTDGFHIISRPAK